MKIETKRRLYCYQLKDGRTALTRCNLAYATDDQGNLDLASVKGEDVKFINLIAEPELGHLLSELYGNDWLDPERVFNMKDRERLTLPYYQHCAILARGKMYVRDGKYIPLTQFIRKASQKELAAMLWDVAAQAALAQLTIAVGDKKATDEDE